ncbi:putative invertase inhibitor [Diospyros lotus]|uniref:putative invertase inhibitor n=1 Tax=Diospyros lotus TaxID=55363 RepID=UPI0022518EE3|nr:putative invertase inhibitor [Diospyros lotus]
MWLQGRCSFFFVLFFFLLHGTHFPVTALYGDLINATCKQCADLSVVFNYNFCSASLQEIPISHVTNLQGLALVAMELALENVTATISTIQNMLDSGRFDPFAVGCLKDCLELYADSSQVLLNAIVAFLSEQLDAANVLVSAVMETTVTCEEGFREKEGEVSPLTEENESLFQLSDIALCIIKLLPVAFGSKFDQLNV